MSALTGVRVIDAATFVAGPLGATMLGDFGADVVKVEPITGDESRTFGPCRDGQSGIFVGVNRNKRGIAIDLRHQAGLEAFTRLCASADVLIDNLRPSSKQRLGIDDESLRRRNPRLVTVSVSAFGPEGPLAGRPGLDPVAQALTGLMDTTGHEDGGPVKAGPPIADAAAAQLVAFSTVVALFARNQTGEGQSISVSLVDALLHLQAPWVGQYLLAGYVQPRVGNASNVYAPYDAFACADGGLVHVVAFNDRHFENLCDTMGRKELLVDERFCDGPARLRHRHQLRAQLAPWFLERTRDEAVRLLGDRDVICAPVLSYPETFAHPQIVANHMAVPVEHSVLGPLRVPGVPAKLSATPGEVRCGPPSLGEHTDQVLAELGYSPAEIHDLKTKETVR